MPTTSFDKSTPLRRKGFKNLPKRMISSAAIPSIRDVVGIKRIVGGNDYDSTAFGTYDYLPTGELLHKPFAIDTTQMALDWATGKIQVIYSYQQ